MRKRGQCLKPWIIPETLEDMDKVHNRTLQTVSNAWACILQNEKYKDVKLPAYAQYSQERCPAKITTITISAETTTARRSSRSRMSIKRAAKTTIGGQYTPVKNTENERKKKRAGAIADPSAATSSSKNSSSSFIDSFIQTFTESLSCRGINEEEISKEAGDEKGKELEKSFNSLLQNFTESLSCRTNEEISMEKELEEKQMIHELKSDLTNAHKIISNLEQERSQLLEIMEIYKNNFDRMTQYDETASRRASTSDALVSSSQKNRHKKIVDVRHQSKIELKAKLIDEIKAHFKSKKFQSKNKLARRILGEMIATHPSISFEVLGEISTLSRAQLCEELDLVGSGKNQVQLDQVNKSAPSEATFRNILIETTIDVLFLINYDIFYRDQAPAVFLSCDKAPSGSLIKIINWFSMKKNKVEQKILDVDQTLEDSEECAKAM